MRQPSGPRRVAAPPSGVAAGRSSWPRMTAVTHARIQHRVRDVGQQVAGTVAMADKQVTPNTTG